MKKGNQAGRVTGGQAERVTGDESSAGASSGAVPGCRLRRRAERDERGCREHAQHYELKLKLARCEAVSSGRMPSLVLPREF